jgi:hypothetical protein
MTHLVTALILVLQTIAPTVDSNRISAIATDMVDVVQGEANSKNGLHIDSNTAVFMLAAAASHESGLLESVETCKNAGDGGRSIGLGQVMSGPSWEGHSKKEICSSRKLQLQLSVRALDKCWVKTPQPDATFRCYTAGSATIKSYAARHTLGLFNKIKKSVEEYASTQKVEISFLN